MYFPIGVNYEDIHSREIIQRKLVVFVPRNIEEINKMEGYIKSFVSGDPQNFMIRVHSKVKFDEYDNIEEDATELRQRRFNSNFIIILSKIEYEMIDDSLKRRFDEVFL